MKKSIIALFFFFLTIIQSPVVMADLLVSPIRVAFEDRARSQVVTLINRSEETKTYRIEWLEKQMNEMGKYIDIETDENYIGASDLIRYSPRQVVLGPGEKQSVRLAVRKPAGLPDGEYRSHLLFKQLANITDESEQKDRIGIKLYMNVSISIPVIVRHGKTDVKATISNIQYQKKDLIKDQEYDGITMTINREGNASSYGTVRVYDVNDVKRANPIATLNNVAVFKETPLRNIRVSVEKPIPENVEDVVAVYEGRDEYRSIIFDEKRFTLP